MIGFHAQTVPRLGLACFALVFAFCVSTQAATAKCGLPREVLVLMDDLYTSTLKREDADAGLAFRLRENSSRIDMSKVNSKLFAVGMSHRRDQVDTLLKEAQLIDAAGHAISPNILREKLKRAERLDALVCKLERTQKKKERPDASKAEEKQPSPPVFETAGSMGATARLVVLLLFATLMIGGVFLIRVTFVWLHGLVNKRSLCHIPAAVESGLDVIDGYVSVLGRHGCRFMPVNEGAGARLEKLFEGSHAFLICGQQRMLVTLKPSSDHSAVAIYQKALLNEAHARLLAFSQTTPKFAPKRGLSSKAFGRWIQST